MSFIRPWAVWRRIQYAIGFFSVWMLIGVAVFYANFYQPPNCFNLKADGEETGIDCGGNCVRVCATDVISPKLVWAKSFEIEDGQYNVVAYIENENKGVSTPNLEYTFQLLNGTEVVAEVSGSTELPPDSVYPIFEGRVFTEGGQPVTETLLSFKPAEMWVPTTFDRGQFESREELLTGADSKPRLAVKIENVSLAAANDVEVIATIFSDNGEAMTASKSYISRIEGRSTQGLTFTWPNSIAKIVRNCVIPTDVVIGIDLSGSMNNDNDSPPQPVTDALAAAGEFAGNLRGNDLVSVVTFATQADVSVYLTSQHANVSQKILGLTIDPVEETGFTNTAAALKAAQSELSSARHNLDARRVLVFLTDGLPTAKGDVDAIAEAVEAAKSLHEGGVEVYAIGLGQSLNRQFIDSIASDPTNAYIAPSSADLTSIYSEITSSLCEVGPTKIDVIPKTKSNFAPLR